MSSPLTKESVQEIVRQVIADVTGNDIAEVHPQAELEDELGVTPVDLGRIIVELNKELDIQLSARDVEAEEVTTVQELTVIVSEEALLG